MGAQQQYKQRMEEIKQNAINSSNATEAQYRNLNIRALQEDQAQFQQAQETEIETSKQAASVEVAASAGNLTGLAVNHVLSDLYAQKGRATAAMDVTRGFNRSYLQGEKKAAEAGGQSQANSIPLPEKPSFLPYLINIFGSGLSAFGQQQRSY